MLNAQALRSELATGGALPCVVLDDVLLDPQALVDLAARHQAAFAPSPRNAFPGIELPLPERAAWALAEALGAQFGAALGLGELRDAQARLSLVTLAPQQLRPIQRLCHRDRLAARTDERAIAGLLYLFGRPELGGTSFWLPRQDLQQTEALMRQLAGVSDAEADAMLEAGSAYLTDSNRFFERTQCVAPRWNRFIAYDGSQFHSSHIERPDLLSSDPAIGRLTLNFFLRYACEPG